MLFIKQIFDIVAFLLPVVNNTISFFNCGDFIIINIVIFLNNLWCALGIEHE